MKKLFSRKQKLVFVILTSQIESRIGGNIAGISSNIWSFKVWVMELWSSYKLISVMMRANVIIGLVFRIFQN
jgi:hypothetical protein